MHIFYNFMSLTKTEKQKNPTFEEATRLIPRVKRSLDGFHCIREKISVILNFGNFH